MELPNFPLNLKVQLGEEDKENQQTLGHIHIANYGASEVSHLSLRFPNSRKRPSFTNKLVRTSSLSSSTPCNQADSRRPRNTSMTQ